MFVELFPIVAGLANPIEAGPGSVPDLFVMSLSMIGGSCAAGIFLQRKSVSTSGALRRALRALVGLPLIAGNAMGSAVASGESMVGVGIAEGRSGSGRGAIRGVFAGLDVEDLDVGADMLPPSSSASEIGDEIDDDEERTLATLNSLGLGSFSGLIAGRSRETATRRSDLALAALEKKLAAGGMSFPP